MNKITAIKVQNHPYLQRDLIRMSGRLYRVCAVSGSILLLEPAGWFTRTVAWLGSIVRLDGFWGRVWNR